MGKAQAVANVEVAPHLLDAGLVAGPAARQYVHCDAPRYVQVRGCAKKDDVVEVCRYPGWQRVEGGFEVIDRVWFLGAYADEKQSFFVAVDDFKPVGVTEALPDVVNDFLGKLRLVRLKNRHTRASRTPTGSLLQRVVEPCPFSRATYPGRRHARCVRRIGVLTSDFALYHDAIRALREADLAFVSLAFGSAPDPSVGVVLTSWRDAVAGSLPPALPVVAVGLDEKGQEDLAGAISQAVRVLEGVRAYGDLVIGIDPGQRPGVALVADGRLVHASQVYRVAAAAERVRELLAQSPHRTALVRIGDGAPRERDEIVADLWALREEGVRLEVVDESGTTPPAGKLPWPADVAAAIAIARTAGVNARWPRRRRVALGHVRDVQRLSRIQSEGQFTISRQSAERVVRGESTLDEEVRAERERKGQDGSE